MTHIVHVLAQVVSTCVEVFPSGCTSTSLLVSRLHVSGGVSIDLSGYALKTELSPRVWRCFLTSNQTILIAIVVSTCVDVFLANGPTNWFSPTILH